MTLPKDPSKHAEYRKKMSHKGIKRSPETCEKIRLSKKGKKNPNLRRDVSGEKNPNFGHHLSEEAKERIRQARKRMKGKIKFSQESCIHMGEAKKGENNPAWKGGISFEPYCPKFTKKFKERVRAYFGYRCVECGIYQTTPKLPVHHVTFNKKACCDTTIPLFVPLCQSCHSKTQFNRVFWQYWFTEMINRLYGGKCYFSEEEMIAYGKREDNGNNLGVRSTLCERQPRIAGLSQ
jgi:hypothetical protein